ncbi:ANTAR domain-containing response regulator [Paenibacillus gansuensis]|uniref:ANTAR domain-containing response regulator n=1 Tax=Paenibacillus gansuensis TaxID=306542 RepID=A0ABW5PEG2_9BACL
MLHSLLLIDDFRHLRGPHLPSPAEKLLPLGLRVETADPAQLEHRLAAADALLLSVPPDQVSRCRRLTAPIRQVPLIWWCDDLTFPGDGCKMDQDIDGMLSPHMNASDIHCSLMLAFQLHIQRRDWQIEREQLLAKMEERKWIEQAKRILSEIKQISEAEAYDFLRKQAMNERKRMVDVSTSIVKVYELLQGNEKRGRSR